MKYGNAIDVIGADTVTTTRQADFAVFDGLPSAIRDALNDAHYPIASEDAAIALRQGSRVEDIVRAIRDVTQQ